MVQTFFELQGRKYKLKYQKVQTGEGELYQGIVFIQNPLGFSYLRKDDESILFDNEFIDKRYRELIIQIIEEREAREKKE